MRHAMTRLALLAGCATTAFAGASDVTLTPGNPRLTEKRQRS